ncbi:MAG: TIM-barrel domain-containing protein [Myxococcota bacterium]
MWFALACKNDPPPAPPAPEGYTLGVRDDALVLSADGEPLLSLPLGAIAIGKVDAYDDTRSYDPFFPDGAVDWVRVTGVDGDALEFADGSRGALTLTEDGPGRFGLRLTSSAPTVAYFRLGLAIDPEEGLYGLGSSMDHVNRRGAIRPMALEIDPTTEAFDNEAHVRVPLVIGTRGWGVLVRDDHPMTFDLGATEPDRLEITVGAGPDAPLGLALDWYAAAHPLDVTAQYWKATGAHRLPARWALGPLHWRDENEDQAEVEADLRTLRDLDLATTAVWIDRPYATGVNTFDFEAARFPDPESMIALAHELGFRMALWHTPYVAEGETGALFETASSEGYFPPEHPPSFIDWGTPIDLSNPEAYAWWSDLIGRYDAQGIEGYKLDYAEEIVLGLLGGRLPWSFADGSDERTMHIHYQRLYHQVYAETLPEDGGFLLCRTAVWGDQVNGPVIWPGDLDATMAQWAEPATDRDGEDYISVGGMPASLVVALSLGPSGFPFYGADTGGYRHSPPDNETFVRWFEQTALSSVMQIGNSTNDVVWEPDADNGFDADTLTWYREYTRLHLRLWPYLWSESVRIGRAEGRPLMAPLGLAFPQLGVHPDDEYLLGPSLLVAPVVVAGAREREVLFPEGRWIDWFRGDVHEPGAQTVSADLGELPLYLAAGGIVPLLRPTIDTLSPVADPAAIDSYATDPGVLWARVFPGPASAFELFDGARLEQAADGAAVTLGWSDGDEFDDGALLELVGTPEPAEVSIDGDAVERVDDPTGGGWTWSPAVGGTVTIRVPAGSTRIEVR